VKLGHQPSWTAKVVPGNFIQPYDELVVVALVVFAVAHRSLLRADLNQATYGGGTEQTKTAARYQRRRRARKRRLRQLVVPHSVGDLRDPHGSDG
jgi:hypothetical protein